VPRLFVAVRPPASVLDAIGELPRPDAPGVRWVPPEQWHVTLRFLGEASMASLVQAIDEMPACPPVEAVIGPQVSRLGRSVLCLPVVGLEPVAGAVVAATSHLGEPPDPRPFNGHLTLARLGRRGSCGLAGHRFVARFTVDTIEVVRSTLAPSGAQHEVMHRRRLTDAG
jgi:2'-5' RNA ligase